MQLLLIFVGGGLGSLARYCLSLAFPLVDGAFPTGTFLANALASLLAGLLFGYALTSDQSLLAWRSFLLVGFCGGFSTFSTFFAGELFSAPGGPLGHGCGVCGGQFCGLHCRGRAGCPGDAVASGCLLSKACFYSYFQFLRLPSDIHSMAVRSRFSRVASVLASVSHWM
jgi:protein CrcB